MSSLNYRPDIEGLRAIAVMSVVLFHADISYIPGGFTGVDVFFVISGFLITRLIRSDLEQDRFSYADFYLRRSRRLFPALFFTLFLVLLFATILLLPSHLERLGGALVSALFWCSNIFFWTESGYFDADAALKPLLHTWSLGVEEQFYLAWPAFLVLLFAWKPKAVLPGVVIASFVSLFFANLWLEYDADAVFYLMPFRVFEFGIGALLVWGADRQLQNSWLLEILMLVGLTALVYSFLVFNEYMSFPGYNALIPCFGTALVIYSGEARLGKLVLCNPVSRYLGLVSYSLYLVHWPIVVFYKYVAETFRSSDKISVVLIAIVLAGLMYRFVESPLRRLRPNSASPTKFIVGCLVSAAFLTVISLAVLLGNGFPARWDLPTPILELATNQLEIRDRTWDFVNNVDGSNGPEFSSSRVGAGNDGAGSVREPKVRLLLVGDSHSKDTFNAILLNSDAFSWLDLRRIVLHDECLYKFAGDEPPDALRGQDIYRCEREYENWEASKLPETADWIAFSARWEPKNFVWLSAFSEYLKRTTSAELALFGRTAEFKDVPRLAVRFGKIEGFSKHAAEFRNRELDRLNESLAAKAQELGVPYIDKLAIICNAEDTSCDMIDSHNNLLFYDYGHWTISGARHFGRKMASSGLLSPLRR